MGDMSLTSIPKLGFGLMRLPQLDGGKTDIEQVKTMVDLFMDAGFNYFDTAYVYGNGDSELAAGEALVKRYPRDSYFLATKLNAGEWAKCYDEESGRQQFYTSLERTGAGYFDFYLLHALQAGNYKRYEEFHLWDFLKELKQKGLVRHYGFSFHASPELLEELLTAHPDVDFIQLQINYADLDNPDVASRRNMEVAARHCVPFTIMEPVKGGKLASLDPEAEDVFRSVHPDQSIASWAIRFAASQKGVITTLSGMSNIEQMKDNISFMKDFKPLDEEELAAVEKVRDILGASRAVPCTACHYCTDGCPMEIPIPDIFTSLNILLQDKEEKEESLAKAKAEYEKAVAEGHKASDCIECGQCEGACPQQIQIIEMLKLAADKLEG